MAKREDSWKEMLQALQEFRREQGHCNVPTNYAANPRLGRWVASRRYKRRVGDLPQERIDELDRLDFVWSPAQRNWENMLRKLAAFKRKHGHCDVPEHWPENQSLANWVQSQRHRARKGTLTPERQQELERLGFTWAIYKKHEKPMNVLPDDIPAKKRKPTPRLYMVRPGVYVQHCGDGNRPELLESYVKSHRGELPPYIPLPLGPTVFVLGVRHVREKRYPWDGREPLPQPVMDVIRRTGTLPPHEAPRN